MRRSYNSYLKYRQMWKEKRYQMDATMTIQEYTKWHVLESLKGGDPNIARTIARESLSYTATAARAIAKKAREIKPPKPKAKKIPSIYNIRETMRMSAERINEDREEEYEDIRERYSNWRDIIRVDDREQVFLDLAAAEIDLDMWKLPDNVRDDLYHDELKRFRERFEADLYGNK